MNETVTPNDVWGEWLCAACQLNEFVAPVRETEWERRAGSSPAGEGAPGTDFNRRGSWEATGLFDAGWSWERRSGEDAGLIRRPGKESGVSASVGMVTSKEKGWPLFWCWSTSVGEFVAEQPYTRFAVYAILKHGGDFGEAAKALHRDGYGSRQPEVVIGPLPRVSADGTVTPVAAVPTRSFKWMSELQTRTENDKWLWHGYLSRGGITLLSALWKAGKSTLLSHMLRAFDGRSETFLGLPITPSRVLYVSEEHEELWAERRDELNIGDHVGMISRPFRGRPSPAEWAKFLGDVVGVVREFRFDVVIMDTISKLWPVREENDAGQVEDALMPIWSITDTGAALALVHHNRKSDGKEFTGSRGSGGLPAFCETLIEFRRASDESKDRRRLLTGGGRYRETPDKLLIELTPSGYVSHGDPDEMTPEQKVTFGAGLKKAVDSVPTVEERVTLILTESAQPWLTSGDIDAALKGREWGARNGEVAKALSDLYGRGELRMAGKRQSKTFPLRFCLASRAGEHDSPYLSDPGNERGGDSGEETDGGE